MATGAEAFKGDIAGAIYDEIVHRNPPLPSTLNRRFLQLWNGSYKKPRRARSIATERGELGSTLPVPTRSSTIRRLISAAGEMPDGCLAAAVIAWSYRWHGAMQGMP